MSKWQIAVHCGAGGHDITTDDEKQLVDLMKISCAEAAKILDIEGKPKGEDDNTAVMAVARALEILEDSPLTNAGHGSNLSSAGTVETEATLMESSTGWHGTCAAVPGVKNPIRLAEALLREQIIQQNDCDDDNLLERPTYLVGTGARTWAKSRGLSVSLSKDFHITDRSRKLHHNIKKRKRSDTRMDTIGAICVDITRGRIAVGASSGGIANKPPGRIGHVGIPYRGTYVTAPWNFIDSGPAIAICSSGTGEKIIRSGLISEIATVLNDTSSSTCNIPKSVQAAFDRSNRANGNKVVPAGVLALVVNSSHSVSTVVAHSTAAMAVGVFSDKDSKPTAQILRQSSSNANTCVSVYVAN